MNKNQGFTLIELLVVVLIIGILSAVALPQYRIAVEKARYVQLMTVADAVMKAQQVYFMANGEYAVDLNDLDISFPAGGTVSEDGKKVEYETFAIWNMVPSYMALGGGTKTGPSYLVWYKTNNKECRTAAGDTKNGQVCKALGATYKGIHPNQEAYYVWE